jgi:hypothetical protein
MHSHPDAKEKLAQMRATMPDTPSTEQRLLARVPQLLDLLKAIGHGHLSVVVADGQLVRLDVMTSES